MPEADVQKDLIRKYNTQLAEAKKDQDSIDNLQYQIEQYILKKLGISFKRSSFNPIKSLSLIRGIRAPLYKGVNCS